MSRLDRPIPNPMIVLRQEFDDWAILFNPDTAEAVGINPVGVAIWKLIDGRRSVKQIVTEIKGEFSEVPEGAEKEVSTFVDDLAEKGFVGY